MTNETKEEIKGMIDQIHRQDVLSYIYIIVNDIIEEVEQ